VSFGTDGEYHANTNLFMPRSDVVVVDHHEQYLHDSIDHKSDDIVSIGLLRF
jgi:hypothetical protein